MAEYIKYGLSSISQEIRSFFPDDNWSVIRTKIPGTLADVEKKEFSKTIIRQTIKQHDWEDDNDTKRFIKSISNRIESETIDAADTLLSVFVEETCKRGDKVKTTIIEDIDTPEFKESPLNINFPKSAPSLKSTGECVICVEHKDREQDPFVRCENCNGSGFVKCERCEGSGREQYVAGNYASGEDRIETGSCPECGGRGRIPCPNCNGEGRVAIYSREYTLKRSVEETVQYKIEGCYWNPWGLWKHPFAYSQDLSEVNDPYSNMLSSLAKSALRETFECVSYRNKNRKQVEIDNRSQLENLMHEKGQLDAYNRNLASFKSNREDEDALIISLREQHYVIPAKLMAIKLKNKQNINLLICQFDDNTLMVASSDLERGYLSAGAYFFSSIYYALVRLGRAAYNLVVKP